MGITVIDHGPFWKGTPKSRVFINADGAVDVDTEIVRKYPPPPIYVECELCGKPWQQVEWARFDIPFVCGHCASGTRSRSIAFGDVAGADDRAIRSVHAVLKALESEVKNVRRAAL